MSKLLLASNTEFVIEQGLARLFPDASKIKIAYITTAAKPTTYTGFTDVFLEMMRAKGYDVTPLDIEGYSSSELKKFLADKNAIFMEGGNTCYLLRAMRATGFDKVIKELLPQGLIYMGGSAGAYVACPTIEMALWRHQDKYDHYGLTDLSAMNLVPFSVSVHYAPEHHDPVVQGIAASRYSVRILTDEQAILVKDGKAQLLGDGEEVKL